MLGFEDYADRTLSARYTRLVSSFVKSLQALMVSGIELHGFVIHAETVVVTFDGTLSICGSPCASNHVVPAGRSFRNSAFLHSCHM